MVWFAASNCNYWRPSGSFLDQFRARNLNRDSAAPPPLNRTNYIRWNHLKNTSKKALHGVYWRFLSLSLGNSVYRTLISEQRSKHICRITIQLVTAPAESTIGLFCRHRCWQVNRLRSETTNERTIRCRIITPPRAPRICVGWRKS